MVRPVQYTEVMYIQRGGDGCDSPKVLDASTGICELPKPALCEADNGQVQDETGACVTPPSTCPTGDKFPAKGADSPVINSQGRNYVSSPVPPTACFQGCQYAPNESTRAVSCWLNPGSLDRGYCNYIIESTGQPCNADAYDFASAGDLLNPTSDQPDNRDPGCPKGWAWSGTTCVRTSSGGEGSGGQGSDKDKDPGGGGGAGGGGDKAPGGDGQDGGTDGDKGKDKEPGIGTGDGKDPNKGSSLKPPKTGSFDNANKEWDAKAEQARKAFNDKLKQQINSFKGVFDVNLGQGAGSLPCDRFTVLGQTLSLCLTDYATELAYLRQILLLVASVIAATIVLRD